MSINISPAFDIDEEALALQIANQDREKLIVVVYKWDIPQNTAISQLLTVDFNFSEIDKLGIAVKLMRHEYHEYIAGSCLPLQFATYGGMAVLGTVVLDDGVNVFNEESIDILDSLCYVHPANAEVKFVPQKADYGKGVILPYNKLHDSALCNVTTGAGQTFYLEIISKIYYNYVKLSESEIEEKIANAANRP